MLHLGDVIDGNTTLEATLEDFRAVMDEFDKLEGPTLNITHCIPFVSHKYTHKNIDSVDC